MQTLPKVKIIQHANVIGDLNKIWTPHSGQVPIGKAIFHEHKSRTFVECGRKFGKTEIMLYFLYRMLLTIANSGNYYFAPFLKQAREIIWASRRIQNFLPPHLKARYGITVNNSDLRISCAYTGGFIKLDGSDNYAAHAGTNPHSIGYDEFKDFRPEFHRVMDPNLATYEAPLLIIGTPPETEDNQFCELASDVQQDVEQGAYFNLPTWANPHISKDWLKKKRIELFRSGREEEWYREYEARRVKGGKKSIFPMYNPKSHMMPYDQVIQEFQKDRKRMTWQCIADPASMSVFGVLFRAIHPYTKVIYRLNCLYVDTPSEMTSRSMWDKIFKIIMEINPRIEDWDLIYDEAASWFANEMLDIFEDEQIDNTWVPSEKYKNKKEYGINLIREQMLMGKYIVTDRCKKLIWEVENYIKDDKGRIPKENDHLIDCDRYGDQLFDYSIRREKAPEPADPDEARRGYTMDEDLRELEEQRDWTASYGDVW